MKGFVKFLLKHHFTLIFLVLQFISFVLIVNYNKTQKVIFINSSSHISGIFNTSVSSVSSYFQLREDNIRLLRENTNLRNLFLKNYKLRHVPNKELLDSLYLQNYRFISAEIIQSSVRKTRNYLTLNVGAIQGVRKGSGVVSADGVVGVIKVISDNYSVVLPIINTDCKVSCRINRSQYYGSLTWKGGSYRTAELLEIPFHVDVEKGDSLFTTGFSSIFPTGELVGWVDNVEKKEGENFYSIQVKLSVDFQSLRYVYVVDHLLKFEMDSLKVKLND